MPSRTGYAEQCADIARRAHIMKSTLVEPFRKDDGSFLRPNSSAEASKCSMILESATSSSAYSAVKNGSMIAAIHARALQGYETIHGHLPSDDLLASAHQATENALTMGKGNNKVGGIFESADMDSTEGIIMRDRLVALELPVLLHSISSGICTFLPGDFNQSEFFRIRRKAASTFGTVQQGDYIEADYAGQYSSMDQRVELGTGDDETTVFTFNSTTAYGSAYPFKKKRTRLFVDRDEVANDAAGTGLLSGVYDGAVVSATIDYSLGKVTATFGTAPADGIEIHLGFDVDIETDSSLIPRITHEMDSKVLYPHECAITGSATIQALWALRREIGQDIDSLNMQSMRNLLAADKDRKHLSDMMFYSKKHVVEWNYVGAETLTLREHYESLLAALLQMDATLVKANTVAGLSGLVAGTMAANIFRYLPAPYFVPAPNYRFSAQPHYVGRVFGQWDLYCNPQSPETYSCLCYARGTEYGETAYLIGDAVPALTFKHPVLGDLTQSNTMWGLSYRDLQPFDGADFLGTLEMVSD